MAKPKLSPALRDKLFRAMLRGDTLPQPIPEYRFHPTRRWRFDYCWPYDKLALEIEGGVFTRGRHTRGAGYLKDMDKYSEAAALGYRILRVTPTQLLTPTTINLIRRALAQEEPKADATRNPR